MADNVELRIVLVDQDGVGTEIQGPAGQQSQQLAQTPFLPPTSPATITGGPPQQPITFQALPQTQPLQPVTVTPQQPATIFHPEQPAPVQPQAQPVQQPPVSAQSQQTSSIYGFQQPVTATQPPAGPAQPTGYSSGPASTAQPIMNAITPRDEAKQILQQRAFDAQVQAELNKLDPPKQKPDFSTSASVMSGLSQASGSMGMRRTAKTFQGAAESAAKGGLSAGGAGALAATVALDAFTDSAKAATSGLIEISAATGLMARGQNFAAITRAADDAASAIGKIPVVGGALEATFEAATFATKAFGNAVQAFVDRGAELARFSPEISQARARSDIRQLQGDIRESQTLGPNIARLTELQSQGSDQFREILLPLKKVITDDLVESLGKINGLIDTWAPHITASFVTIYEEIKAILQYLTFHREDAANTVAQIPQKIADAVTSLANNKRPTGEQAQFVLGELMKAAQIKLPQRRPGAPPPAAAPAFNFPMK